MEEYKQECILLLNSQQAKYKYELWEMLSLKLYTDETNYTTLFRQCFRSNARNEMREEFYLWAIAIHKTFMYHSCYLPLFQRKRKKTKKTVICALYHGLTEVFALNNTAPKYNGPVSTSLQSSVAAQFSNNTGLIWCIQADYANPFKTIKGIDVCWISTFKNEAEVLLNDEHFCILQAHHCCTDIRVRVDHLLHQLKIYQHKIEDRHLFWRQIGFIFIDNMLSIIKIHPFFLQHSAYKPNGFKLGRTIFQRLYEELHISDTIIMEKYVHDAALSVDHLLCRLQKYAWGNPQKERFLAESGVVINDATISLIQRHRLLFKYHIYKQQNINHQNTSIATERIFR
eukprot:992504_1